MPRTPRIFHENALVIASHNPGKVKEISDLLGPFGINIISATMLGLLEPAETGLTYKENAVLKAQKAARASNLASLADDSGLAVSALDGAPGIYSARWAGPNKDFQGAMQCVENRIAGQSNRHAKFVCALSLCWPDEYCETFEGEVNGSIVWPPRGEFGFGYDPIFLPDRKTETFGEMDPDCKHAMSHRAVAFKKLVNACFIGR